MEKVIIDMHCHTTESDGMHSPETMLYTAQHRNIKLFAITDHDAITRIPSWSTGYHQDHDQHILHGAEVSIHFQDGEFSRSIHVPIYAHYFSQEVDDLLLGIRRGRQRKVELQCERLAENGCMIQLEEGVVPFSFEALQKRFPDTRGDGFNNGHLVFLVREYRNNIENLQKIVPEIHEKNLMTEGFKSTGKYVQQISLRKRPPDYEPSLGELMQVLDSNRTLISLAHPNYTFRSIAEFEKHIGAAIDQGVNAIEINSGATREWVNAILAMRKEFSTPDRPILLTFGSDCHTLVAHQDRRHHTLADVNPHVSSRLLATAQEKIIETLS